jgi:hypothetical protein
MDDNSTTLDEKIQREIAARLGYKDFHRSALSDLWYAMKDGELHPVPEWPTDVNAALFLVLSVKPQGCELVIGNDNIALHEHDLTYWGHHAYREDDSESLARNLSILALEILRNK